MLGRFRTMKGSILKRGKRYSVIVDLGRDPVTQKRQQKWHSGFATRKLAEQACVELIHSLHAGTYVEPTRLTTGEFLIQWLDRYAKPNVSIKTYVRYEEIIKGRLLRDLGGIPLRKLKP